MKQITYCTPTKIILTDGNVRNAESLLKTKVTQIGLGENDLTLISGNARVVLDFGRETCGGVRILTHYINGGKPVGIRFGESVTEAITPLGVKNATNDHSPRDFLVEIPQLSDLTFGQTGFRFVCLEFYGGDYEIKSVLAESVTEKHEIKGAFECSDPLVNEIYSTARRTLLLCLQNDVIWDGIKRDRLVWIGDLHPETLGLLYSVGDVGNIENCLDFAAAETLPTDWMNGLTAYSFWWIIVLYDYYRFTGKTEILLKHADYLETLIRHADSLIEEDGSTNFPSDFLDWPTSGSRDAAEGVASLAKIACDKAAILLRIANKDASLAENAAAKLSRRKTPPLTYKQAAAMRYLAFDGGGKAVGELLIANGAKGLSTFMSYYILTAIKRAATAKNALDIMKEYYGGMLKKGATSFWEDFDVDWTDESGRIDELPQDGQKDIHGDYGKYCYTGFRHSLCHGWSCGPIQFLSETVLGVNVTAAGCKKITIAPALCGLKYASGKFPTPFGVMDIRHDLTEAGIKTKIIAPKEIEISLIGCEAEIKRV